MSDIKERASEAMDTAKGKMVDAKDKIEDYASNAMDKMRGSPGGDPSDVPGEARDKLTDDLKGKFD